VILYNPFHEKGKIILIPPDMPVNYPTGRNCCENRIPILSASPELLDGYEDHFADDVIEKPFEASTLTSRINRFLYTKG